MSDLVLDGRLVFETARLRLRSFRPEDLAPFAVMNTDPEVMRYLGKCLTPGESDALALGAQQSFVDNNYGQLAVERITDGTFMGTCGLSGVSWYPGEVQAGWRFARPFWGHGYASEAAAAWLAHGFGAVGLDRIIAVADKPNARSIGVMQRLGFDFQHEAELEDEGGKFEAVVYALSASDWQSRSRVE